MHPLTRRGFLAAATGAALAGTASRAPAFAASPTAYLGISNNGTEPYDELEGAIGRHFAGQRKNRGFREQAPTADELSLYGERGYHAVFHNIPSTLGPDPTTGGKIIVPWREVGAGSQDAYFDRLAEAARATGYWSPRRPLIVCFHHEQSVDTAGQPGYPSCGSYADYRKAFARMHARFHRKTALVGQGGPIAVAFAGLWSQFTAARSDPARIGHFEPPAYDYLGVDDYNRVGRSGALKQGSNAAPVLDAFRSFALGRPKRTGKAVPWLIIPECGCEHATGEAAWWNSLFQTVKGWGGKRRAGACRGIWLTHEPQNGPWDLLDGVAAPVIGEWGAKAFYRRTA